MVEENQGQDPKEEDKQAEEKKEGEEEKEEKKEEENGGNPDPAVPSDSPDPSKKKSPLQKSREVLKGLKEQNERLEANLERAEKLQADELLGGRSSAGRAPTKDEKEIEGAKELLKGTGYDEQLFPEK